MSEHFNAARLHNVFSLFCLPVSESWQTRYAFVQLKKIFYKAKWAILSECLDKEIVVVCHVLSPKCRPIGQSPSKIISFGTGTT